jgi:ribosomal protein L22
MSSLFDIAKEEQKKESTKLIKGKPFVISQDPKTPTTWTFKSGLFDSSIKKTRPVARLVVGMSFIHAMTQLRFCKKKPALFLARSLMRMASSVKSIYGGNINRLEISNIQVQRGHLVKDVRIHGRGRAGRMHHPTARYQVELRHVPDSVPMKYDYAGIRYQSEFEKIYQHLKSFRLRRPMNEPASLTFVRYPWSLHGFKYLRQWNDPKMSIQKPKF